MHNRWMADGRAIEQGVNWAVCSRTNDIISYDVLYCTAACKTKNKRKLKT